MLSRILALCLFSCVGCASLFASHAETISFTSNQPGDKVKVDGAEYEMPAQVTLGTDKTHMATFPNGETYIVKRGMSGWFWANILLGGIVGMTIDLITGRVNANLYPNHMEYRDGAVFSGKKQLSPKDAPVVKDKKAKKPYRSSEDLSGMKRY